MRIGSLVVFFLLAGCAKQSDVDDLESQVSSLQRTVLGLQRELEEVAAIKVVEGTILNRNYTDANPQFASIPLLSGGDQPIVVFFGIENANGFYTAEGFSSVIWGGSDPDFTVEGTSGWYLLAPDFSKRLVSSNYRVKFLQ